MKKPLLLIAATAGLFLILALGINLAAGSKTSFFHFDGVSAPNEFPWMRLALLGVSMVVGIICGSVHRKISSETVISKGLLPALIGDPSLWKSLLASPLVFSGVYALSKDNPDLIIATVLAFENGFLAHILVQKKLVSHEAPTAP